MSKEYKACGRKVVLKKLEMTGTNRMYGSIIVPLQGDENAKMTKAEVLSVGPLAVCKGVKEGDIVLYDTMSVFDNSKEVVITNVENVIMKVIEE